MLGYSAVLTYKNFCTGCGNIIVGGINYVQPDDLFMLSIARLKEDGTADTDAFWHINQDSENSDTDTPYIDHMHLDSSTGEDWLFGTSRSRKQGNEASRIYFWKLKLDAATHNPVESSIKLFLVTDGIRNDGYVTGIRPIMNGGDMHMVYQRDNSNLFYSAFDWTGTTRKAAEIHDKVIDGGEVHTVFAGTNRELTINNNDVMNRWQGYIGCVK